MPSLMRFSYSHSPLFPVLLSLLLVSLSLHCAEAQQPLYVLNLMPAKDTTGGQLPMARFLTGLYASLEPSGTTATGADGRDIVLVEPENDSDSIELMIQKGLQQQQSSLAAVGPLSDALLEKAAAFLTSTSGMTLIGPYTVFSNSRVWQERRYFIRPDPTAELYAVASFAAERLRVRRVGIVYLTTTGNGKREYDALTTALKAVQRQEVFVLEEAESSTSVDSGKLKTFAEQKPQAIFLCANSAAYAQAFVTACASNDALKDVPLLFTSMSYEGVNQAGEAAPSTTFNYYFSSTNLLPSDTGYKYIQKFQTDAQNYLARNTQYFNTYADATKGLLGGLVVYGWLVGQVLIESLTPTAAVATRPLFQASLFNQKSYVIANDVFLGIFAGDCTSFEEVAGNMCQCNQGGHSVSVYNYQNPAALPARQSTYVFPPDKCYTEDTTLPYYGQAVVPKISSATAFAKATSSMLQAFVAGAPYYGTGAVRVAGAQADVSSSADVVDYYKDNAVDAFVGPMVEINSTARGMGGMLVDPFGVYPTPRVAAENVLYTTPTVDQQLYLYAQLAKAEDMSYGVLLRSSSGEEGIRAVVSDAATLGRAATVSGWKDAGSVTSALSAELVVAVGLEAGAAQQLKAGLDAKPGHYVAVLYEEFALYYDEFVAAFTGGSTDTLKHLLVATNLPMWTGKDAAEVAAYPLLATYQAAFSGTPDLVNPLSLQAWCTAEVLQSILYCTNGDRLLSVTDCTYRYSTLSCGGVALEKYYWDDECEASGTCKNYGAQNISVISMARVLDSSSVPPSFGPYNVTPGSSSAIPKPDDPTTGEDGVGSHFNWKLLLAILLPLLILFLLLLALLLYCCCWRKTRDNSTAPKDSSRPVTLMFTDIQSSTSLWALFPEEMGVALDTHHSIIRRQIKEFKCYEVKTIGDSFMIASDSSVTMVRLAVSIQEELHKHDWGTDCFDKFYRQCELEKEEAERDKRRKELSMSKPPEFLDGNRDNYCDTAAYKSRWNGIRVRAGMHTGLCDIRLDEVTKGYDYYGDTVNTAARTESTADGGQVLMTQSTWDNANESKDFSAIEDVAVRDAGAHTLRGVPHPVQMYQIDAIAGREFRNESKELKSDSEEEEEEGQVEEGGTLGGMEVPKLNSALAGTVYDVVDGVLSTFPQKRKFEELKVLMTQWRLPTDDFSRVSQDEKGLQILMTRFSNRTAKVIGERAFLSRTSGEEEHGGAGGRIQALIIAKKEAKEGTLKPAGVLQSMQVVAPKREHQDRATSPIAPAKRVEHLSNSFSVRSPERKKRVTLPSILQKRHSLSVQSPDRNRGLAEMLNVDLMLDNSVTRGSPVNGGTPENRSHALSVAEASIVLPNPFSASMSESNPQAMYSFSKGKVRSSRSPSTRRTLSQRSVANSVEQRLWSPPRGGASARSEGKVSISMINPVMNQSTIDDEENAGYVPLQPNATAVPEQDLNTSATLKDVFDA